MLAAERVGPVSTLALQMSANLKVNVMEISLGRRNLHPGSTRAFPARHRQFSLQPAGA